MLLNDTSGQKRLRWQYHQTCFPVGAGHGRRRTCTSHAPLVCHTPEKPKLLAWRYRSLHRFVTRLPKSTIKYWADQVEIQRESAEAWIRLTEGKSEEALRQMRSAAEHEDAADKHAVTPGVILPAREMLGDMLLQLKQPTQAMNEFEAVLRTAPNRFNALAGAARSREAFGK